LINIDAKAMRLNRGILATHLDNCESEDAEVYSGLATKVVLRFPSKRGK
jgi:hypothetical protein